MFYGDCMKDLTAREKDIYNFICDFWKVNGYSPSVREIQKGVFLNSPNMIHRYLYHLLEKGYINIIPNIARSITIKRTI